MSKPLYKVALAINQPLAEVGIVNLLDSNEYEIVANAHSSDDVINTVHQLNPDLLITDYNLPGFISIEQLQDIINSRDNLKVLIISSDDSKVTIMQVIQFGIKGFITRQCSKEEFLLAVQATVKGEKFFCSKVLNILLEKHLPEKEENAVLTTREREILKYLAQGHSTQRIADTLFLSPHTIQTHRKSIIRKLKIKSPTQFVIFALDMGLIAQR